MHFDVHLDREIIGANVGLRDVFIIHSGLVFGACLPSACLTL